jgi:hypothetical protein
MPMYSNRMAKGMEFDASGSGASADKMKKIKLQYSITARFEIKE